VQVSEDLGMYFPLCVALFALGGVFGRSDPAHGAIYRIPSNGVLLVSLFDISECEKVA